MSSKELYFRLLRHVRPYWRTFALGIFAMVVMAASEPAMPALLKPMLDGSFVEKDLSSLHVVSILLVLVFLVRGASSFLSSIAMSWVSGKLVMDLRASMFDKLIAMPASDYDRQSSGEMISKLTFDVTQVTEASTHVLTVLVKDTLATLGLIAWMLYIDSLLTLITLTTIPFIVLVITTVSGRLRRASHGLQASMGGVTHVIEESIEGQKVVKVFGGQDYERRRFREAINKVRRFQFKFAAASAASAPIAQLFVAIALATIVFVAAHQSAKGQISVGGFVSFFAAMGMLFTPLKRLSNVTSPLQRGLAAAESVFELIDRQTEDDSGTRILDRGSGAIEFRQVHYRYPETHETALTGIELSISPGETVALVGPSGSGKTTLVNLLPRFYDKYAGTITLDGIDIRELSLGSLRSNFSLVSQEVVLFNDTIAANIAYGPLAGLPEHQVLRAAEAANAMQFISELPKGLQTEIGEKGVRLSGGQRQRLAIARAFLKNAPVLILDEATSSLDSVTEREIRDSLETLRQNRTTIVIAHRLSTIEHADRIVVMSKGRVEEVGTHETLLKNNRLYAGLYRFQFSRQGDAGRASGATG